MSIEVLRGRTGLELEAANVAVGAEERWSREGSHLLNHKRGPLAYGRRAQARNAGTVDLDAAYAYPLRGSRHE